MWITLSVQDNTLHTLCDITQRVSNYYTLYSKRPIFRVQSGKKLHQAEKIYTGTACGACDKYEVCSHAYEKEKIEKYFVFESILQLKIRFTLQTFVQAGETEKEFFAYWWVLILDVDKKDKFKKYMIIFDDCSLYI